MPCDGPVTSTAVSGWAVGSVSLASTPAAFTVSGVSSLVDQASGLATGVPGSVTDRTTLVLALRLLLASRAR